MLALLLVLPLSSAFGPHSHNYITNKIKEQGQDNHIVQMCLNGGINEQAFRAGTVIPDITVTRYFSQGGTAYKATHNFLFQQEVMSRAVSEDQKCFGYGIMGGHLVQDAVSHTMAIPGKIENKRIPNWLLHPLWEKKVDSQLVREHPELMEQTKHMLDIMYISPYGDKYIEMIEDSLGENIDFDVQVEIDNLAFALDSFYDKAYKPRVQDNSLFVLYPLVDKLTNFMHPIVGKLNIQDSYSYMDKGVELTLNVFESPGSRYALSPHGFSELQKADEKATFVVPLVLILLILFSIAIPILLIWLTKKFYWAFLFLLIIPILIIAIAIIYIIL